MVSLYHFDVDLCSKTEDGVISLIHKIDSKDHFYIEDITKIVSKKSIKNERFCIYTCTLYITSPITKKQIQKDIRSITESKIYYRKP